MLASISLLAMYIFSLANIKQIVNNNNNNSNNNNNNNDNNNNNNEENNNNVLNGFHYDFYKICHRKSINARQILWAHWVSIGVKGPTFSQNKKSPLKIKLWLKGNPP